MLRKLALILLPLALLAAACDGDDSKTDDGGQSNPTATVAEPTIPADEADSGGDGDSPGATLLGSLNPFELLGSLGDQLPSASEGVDPSLKGPLLQAGDVPSDYAPLGEFAYSVPSELGELQMAASTFSSGDMASDELGRTVMSAVVALPPEALDEIGDPSELANMSEEDLAELEELEQMGLGGVELLDASDLGDGGVGMHVEFDFSGLFGAFGAPEGDEPMPAGIAMDMYMFLRGEHMLMVMVIWPAGESSGVDALDLAETMDARAADSF